MSPDATLTDGRVAEWVAGLGLPGLVDLHVHFLPEPVLRKVWAYFDQAQAHYGTEWPVRYRFSQERRLAVLRELGVRASLRWSTRTSPAWPPG